MSPENKTPEASRKVMTEGLSTEEGEKETGGLQMRSPELVLLASSGMGAQTARTAQNQALDLEKLARLIKEMLSDKADRPLSELPGILHGLDVDTFRKLNAQYARMYPTKDHNRKPITRDVFTRFRSNKENELFRRVLVELARLEEPDRYSPDPGAGFIDGNLDFKIKGSDVKKEIGILGQCPVGERFSTNISWFDSHSKANLGGGENLMMQVLKPNGELIQRFRPDTFDVHFTPTEPGVYDIIIIENVKRDGVNEYDIYRGYVLAHTREGVQQFHFGGIDPVSPEDLKTKMMVQELALGAYGVKDQKTGPEYITGNVDNPLRPQSGIVGGNKTQTATYTAHGIGGKEDLRTRWYVALENKPEVLAKYPELGVATDESRGRLKVPAGHALFHLSFDDSLRMDFGIKVPGQYLLYAEEYTREGSKATGKVARYHQAALNDQQDKARENFHGYQAHVAERMAEFRGGMGVPLRAVHITAEGARTQLTMYLGPSQNGGLLLLDATPGVKEMEYRGETLERLLADFNARASTYPKGHIYFQVPKNNAGLQEGTYDAITKGESDMGALASATGWASLALAGAGMVATVVPGGQVVAPYLFMGSMAIGTASSAASLADHADNASVDKAGVTLDVLSIAMNFIGMGTTAMAARGGGALLGGTRMGRFVLYTNLGLEGGSALVLTHSSVEQIQAIADNDDMTPDEKRNEIIRLIAVLTVTGGLFVLSAKDLAHMRKNGLDAPDPDMPTSPTVEAQALRQLADHDKVTHFQDMIQDVKVRIKQEDKGFAVVYSDIQMADIAILGRELGLPDHEIKDFLFVGQRKVEKKPQKTISIEELTRQMRVWKHVKEERLFPYLFPNRENYITFQKQIKDILKRYNVPSYDVQIQGSSLRNESANDIDIAVFVSKEEFDSLTEAARAGINRRNAGPDKTKILKGKIADLERNLKQGRINSYLIDYPEGADGMNKALYTTQPLFNTTDKPQAKTINLSVMMKGSRYEISPFLKFDQ